MRASRRFLGLALLLTAACPKPMVVVPSTDPKTPPTATLDLNFPQSRLYSVTATDFNPTLPADLSGNESIDLLARCSDATSGCKRIRIEVVASGRRPDGTTTVQTVPVPFAETASPVPGTPGNELPPDLRAVGTLQVGPLLTPDISSLRITVTARAVNAFDTEQATRPVTLYWARNVPLALPACPRFHPVGSAPPGVLDSSVIFKAIEREKNNSPNKASFVFAVYHPDAARSPRPAWRVTVVESGLPVTTASFVFVDETGGGRSGLVTHSNCTTPGSLVTPSGTSPSAPVTATSSDTNTVVFMDPVFGAGTEDVALWSEAHFWAAFGGRTTTFARVQ